MTRVKGGTVARARRKKVLDRAEGYFGSKHRLFKTAQEQLMHSGEYAFRDRKVNRRNFRKLWITRINAACRENGLRYSDFINGLNLAGITINRKMLSELAISDPKEFTKIVALAQEAIKNPKVKPEVKDVKEIKKETVKEEVIDYSKMTVAELKKLALDKNLEVTSSMKKADIIALFK